MDKCYYCGHEKHKDGWQSHAMWCPGATSDGSQERADFEKGLLLGFCKKAYPEDGSEAMKKGWIKGFNNRFIKLIKTDL